MSKKSDEKIETLNVTGAGGTRIDRQKYEIMRKAILRAVPKRKDGVLFKELPALVHPHLDALGWPEEASLMWYLTTVKLDLEARELIERIPKASPQRLRRL